MTSDARRKYQREYARGYRARNPEKVLAASRRYYNCHRKLCNKRCRNYSKTERGRLIKREGQARRLLDLNYRLTHNLRERVRQSLKKGIKKSASTLALVGCSIDKLRERLAAQFQFGMTLENYGKWHVDHIRPCKSFDLSDPKQQRKCFHYTNLQPLWAKKNLSKGAKWLANES